MPDYGIRTANATSVCRSARPNDRRNSNLTISWSAMVVAQPRRQRDSPTRQSRDNIPCEGKIWTIKRRSGFLGVGAGGSLLSSSPMAVRKVAPMLANVSAGSLRKCCTLGVLASDKERLGKQKDVASNIFNDRKPPLVFVIGLVLVSPKQCGLRRSPPEPIKMGNNSKPEPIDPGASSAVRRNKNEWSIF